MKNLYLLFLLVLPIHLIGQQENKKTPITVNELANGVHRLFVNNAVAVVLYSGNDGNILIDTGYERTAIDLKSEIERISAKPLNYIINTHIHGDHTGGNLLLGEGVNIISHINVKDYLSKERKQGERVIPAFPEYAQPNITFTDRLFLGFDQETLQLIHMPGGHTSGDIIIYSPKSKVLVVGDLLFANYFPYVDIGNGGNPLKYLENLEWITNNFPADAIVVGGHGPVYSISEYKQYGETLRNTIHELKQHKDKGMTVEQMKEQRVLKEWESFGSFFITEDRWIDTIFPFI